MTRDTAIVLDRILKTRILLLDGAMGTMLQRHRLTETDFRGERFKDHPRDLRGNNDLLVLTRPELILGVHREYLEAGADVIETNSFNAQAISQADYALESIAYELNVAAARLARQAVDEYNARTPDRPRFVAGSMGPTNRILSISPDVNNPAFRNLTFDELREAFRTQIRGLIDGGADLLLFETIVDTLNVKAGIVAMEEVFEETGVRLPLMISATITDRSGRTLAGQTIDAFWVSIAHAKPFSVGLNCALGAQRHAPVRRGSGPHRHLLRQLLSERGPAERVRRVRRAPDGHGRLSRGVRPERVRQHRWRLLRHDARPHPRDRSGRGRS